MNRPFYVVIGETNVARSTCASLSSRGLGVRHLLAPDDQDLRGVLVDGPAGVAILMHDDVAALRYALAAAHIDPGLRIVVTIFDRTIGDELTLLVPQCVVTSPADLAAPALAGPCVAPGIAAARATDAGSRGVPDDPDRLAWSPLHIALPTRLGRLFTQSVGAMRTHDSGTRMLLWGLLGLAAILAVDWLWLTVGKGHSVAAAFKEAVQVIATVGPGAPTSDEGYAVFSGLAMLAATLLTAMVTAGVVDRLLGTRFAGLVGAWAPPRRDHVIVVGLGQVGLRLCLELRKLGVPVLAVERDPQARNLRLVRSLGIPTIVGDGADRALLERASLHRARCLAAVGSDDWDNIAVSVAAHGVRPGVRLVLRAGEQEALAETRSLLRLGITRDVTVLTATYAVAQLLDVSSERPIPIGDHVYLDRGDTFEPFPLAGRELCGHLAPARAATPVP